MSAAAPFDVAAATYDGSFTLTRLGGRLRHAAWAWIDRAFAPGDRVIEIGCGTGADAVHLADRGVSVVATDQSPAMVDHARRTVLLRGANDLVQVRRLDARSIGRPGWEQGLGAAFDGVLSDFGALNCVPDRVRLLQGLAAVVVPGGRAVLVLMGPLCPWEITWHVLHGEPHAAVRRWRAGAPASVDGGARVRVWYPSVDRVIREAGPWWMPVGVGGLGVALPPSGLSLAMERRERLLQALAPLERWAGRTRAGARIADHWVVELRRRDR